MTDYLSFNIIIDDIVFPDGQTRMGVLGGGGPQAAFGMRLWSDSVGILASAGADLPPTALAWFQETGIDLRALRRIASPPLRAWQAMEVDGRRTQVWRIPAEVVAAHFSYDESTIRSSAENCRGVHLGFHPLEPVPDFLSELCGASPLTSLEMFKPAERLVTPAELQVLTDLGEIISLNLVEAQSLFGDLDAVTLLAALMKTGARIVTLRLGGEGSLTVRQGSGQAIHIPAIPTQVVDPVGAGNAFCGAFLVVWDQSHDLTRAAASGAAAASFLVEQVGLPTWNQSIRNEAERRMRFALDHAQLIPLPQGEISL